MASYPDVSAAAAGPAAWMKSKVEKVRTDVACRSRFKTIKMNSADLGGSQRAAHLFARDRETAPGHFLEIRPLPGTEHEPALV
jgi:hypothetical protein